MKKYIYIFYISFLITAVAGIILLTEDIQNYPPYQERGKKIARLLEVSENNDSVTTVKILDLSQTLHTKEGAAILHEIITYYQLEDCIIELYHENPYYKRFTGNPLNRYQHIETITGKDCRLSK